MKTIMIIDDSESDQYLSEALLKIKLPEVQVIKAYDGEEALELLASTDVEPDLILLDINMPRMDGHEFLEAFTDGNTREIPVIAMMTSSDQKKDKENALSYKCVKEYLLKPMLPDSIQRLAEILSESTQTGK